MRAAAILVSVIFHPLLLTTYLVLVLGIFFPSLLMIAPQNLRVMTAFIFCFTFLLPVVNLIMFRMFGTISSYTLENRAERVIPFVAITLIYLVTAFLFFFKLRFSTNFSFLLLIVSVLVLTAVVLNFFLKISVHALAAWGGVGMLLPLNKAIEQPDLLWPTAGAILITGFIMAARLYLNAHTPREILVGSVSGFIIGFLGVVYFF
ncbi:MAG TPA: phosphatase PAP2 family protein [Cyclobacteriaceae bacterium]|nr:phosphatase PAP2 family protein [Cyclobacteriaceae bacterium]